MPPGGAEAPRPPRRKRQRAVCSGRFRDAEALTAARERFRDEIERFIALQWIFDMQWKALKVPTHPT
jgi:4-alpha-glucanotransferase